jgi:hypothetical protein
MGRSGMISEQEKDWIKYVVNEYGWEQLSERDWKMIEFALELEREKETDGNRLREIRTDLEQERLSLLAAQKMKATGMTKTAVVGAMEAAAIRWAFTNAIMGRDTIEGYLKGRPRGRKPEDYIAQDAKPLGLMSIQAEIEDWESRAGTAITAGLPDW